MKIDISKRANRIAGAKTDCPTASVAAPPPRLPFIGEAMGCTL